EQGSATAAPADSAARARAREILNATGVKGGLVVHLGCGEGRLTAALRANHSYLVHGLDANARNVQKAREHLRSLGLYGAVSVDQLRSGRLPYVDNLVNLLVAEDLGEVRMEEVRRVLAPQGVAYLKIGREWMKNVNPRPDDIDEWTHFLHGPDGNAVAHDTVVGPPRHLQWVGKPKFARAHEQLASLSACVTAGGRIFYVIDETPQADIRLSSAWYLVARDAFSGVVLWARPIPDWADQLRRFRSGPPDLPFRLVAWEDRVYVTLGISAPVSVLDAATGETLWTYEGTEHARQILRVGGKLVVLVDTQPQTTSQAESEIRRGVKPAPGARSILAADASSGEILWRKQVESLVHPTLAAQDGRLFYQTTNSVGCLDLGSGDDLWQAPAQFDLKGHEVGWESPTLVVQDGVVYSADFKRVTAHATEDGEQLWTGPSSAGYNSPPDLFVINGLVWMKGKGAALVGLDPATGAVKREVAAQRGYMHARCYRNKATDRYALLGNQGVQLADLTSGEIWLNYWIRGTCQYGILPANGLLYVTPDSCACNLKTKLNGFYALASGRQPQADAPRSLEALERGPAYGQVGGTEPTAEGLADWPTYRHDAMRSGMTKAHIPARLKPAWQTDVGGRLSGVVVAGGKAFVASVDDHTVHALDATDGSGLWHYTAGGRVDSPPTVYRGLVLFGSADGWVYALRASDGRLAWRFRGAPEDRRAFVNGQLESVWPIHGSVLVKDGQLIVAAGRSSYLDGGIRLCRLEPESGRLISATVIYSPDPETGKQPAEGGKEMRGVLSDVLSSDGSDVYMRHAKLDLETGSETGTGVHLFTPTGFLDDTWWHRSYWVLHDEFRSHWSGWWQIGNLVPSGRILSFDQSSVYGYGRDQYVRGNTGQWRGGEKYQLFAYDRTRQAESAQTTRRGGPAPPLEYLWTSQVPLFVTAMVVADDAMFIAGPPDVFRARGPEGEDALLLENPEQSLRAWRGKAGGVLWAVSTADGGKLGEIRLESPPVFDGMSAANGRLYLATRDGKVLCFVGE
ncbi:MAG: PQQ-binding-like beta-propeller repeat protein, partial [Armatimonadota bacterium]